MDGEAVFPPPSVLLRPFFFAPRARYQYYHNFTFVIGWHRASVTSPCYLFIFFLSLSLTFSLSVFPPVCSFWLLLFLAFTTFSSLFLSFLPPFRITSLLPVSHIVFFLPLQLPIQRPAVLHAAFARFWSLFVTPGYCSSNNCRVRLGCPMTIGETAKIRETDA